MYFKILNTKMNHHGFQYKEGLNIDTVPFNPKGDCEPGGLYFTDEEHIIDYLSFGTLIANVEIPFDAQIYKNGTSWKADKIIISNIRPITEFELSLSPSELIKYIGQYDFMLQFVKEKDQTPELCLLSVMQNGYNIKFVKKQTPELCFTAINQNGFAIKYVREQTPELCLLAVKQSFRTLQYIRERTPELCLEALKQNSLALWFLSEAVIRDKIKIGTMMEK